MNVEALIPRWFRKDEGEWPMPDDVIVPPPIAMLPRPRTDDDKLLAAVAAVRENDRIEMERLKLELGHTLKDLHAEKCKSGLLELDLAQAANTIQTLQSEITERRHFASMMFDINQKTAKVLERFGTHPPPKPERKPKVKKNTDGEGTAETAKADG